MHGGADHYIFNNAQKLRKRLTDAEIKLWFFLRDKPWGLKFRRQHPYGNFILDFFCYKYKLVIEVDGAVHDIAAIAEKDVIRQKELEACGLTFIRFTNNEVIYHFENVIEKIAEQQLTFLKM